MMHLIGIEICFRNEILIEKNILHNFNVVCTEIFIAVIKIKFLYLLNFMVDTYYIALIFTVFSIFLNVENCSGTKTASNKN